MLKRMVEYGIYVEISGFRDISLKNAKTFSKLINQILADSCEVQLFDANLVSTWEHLYFAAVNANEAFRGKYNISKSLAVETVLYASGQRQIQRAIEIIGVKPETKNAAILIICKKLESAQEGLEQATAMFEKKPDETVLELSVAKINNIKNVFGISNDEIETRALKIDSNRALIDLVIERMALLSTQY